MRKSRQPPPHFSSKPELDKSRLGKALRLAERGPGGSRPKLMRRECGRSKRERDAGEGEWAQLWAGADPGLRRRKKRRKARVFQRN